jgi:hypothetical protein
MKAAGIAFEPHKRSGRHVSGHMAGSMHGGASMTGAHSMNGNQSAHGYSSMRGGMSFSGAQVRATTVPCGVCGVTHQLHQRGAW